MPRGFRRDSWIRRRPRAVAIPVSVRMNVATLGDFPPAFASWTAAVKFLGGVPTVWPANLPDTRHAGKPAARYEAKRYAELVNAGKISLKVPQSATKSGYVYVLAPAGAIEASSQLATVTAAEEARLPKESLLDRFLPGASRWVKWGTIALVAGAAIGLARGRGGR